MSNFKRALKYTKDYADLDEKIARANKEFEKTGIVISEGPTNTTSGVYFATDHIPLVPAVTDTVPDTSGVTGSSFTQPTNGDPSNPSNWSATGVYTDTSWMFNSNDVNGVTGRPIITSIDPSVLTAYQQNPIAGIEYPSGGGVARVFIGTGHAVGYLASSGGIFVQVLSPGLVGGTNMVTRTEGYGFGTHYFPATPERVNVLVDMAEAYVPLRDAEARGEITTKTVKAYVPRSQESYNSSSGPKYQSGNSSYVLADVEIFTEPSKYEVTPEVPARTLVLYRTGLDNVGFQKISAGLFGVLKGLYGLGKDAMSYIGDATTIRTGIAVQTQKQIRSLSPKDSAFKKIKDYAQRFNLLGELIPQGEWAVEVAVSSLANKPVIRTEKDVSTRDINKLLNRVNPGLVVVNDGNTVIADGNVFWDEKLGKVKSNHINPNLPDGSGVGQRQNPSNLINKDISHWMDKKIKFFAALNPIASEGAGTVTYNPETGDVRIFNFTYFNSDKKGEDLKSEDTFDLGNKFRSALNFVGIEVGGYGKEHTGDMKGIPKNLVGMKVTNIKLSVSDLPPKFLESMIDRFGPVGNTNFKNVKESKEFSKKSKMVKVEIPGPKDELTVKAIDMIKLHKFNQQEVDEYVEIVSRINQWIRDNPKEYEIWKVRYPANDPRLAELNWKLDSQIRASDQYMEKHFPENRRLFKKVQQSIAKNIEMTDPKSFKGVRVPKYKGVDLTDYKRRRAVVSKHFKKAVKIRKLFSKNRWLQTESFTNITTGNKVGQTFRHNPSGQTVSTAGALGGVESVPSTVSVFGDNIPGPNASSYALQGYAKPLGNVLKRKETEDTNKKLDASQEFVRKVGADEIMDARVNQRGTAKISDKQKRINKAAETLIRYFANKLPEGEWNDYLGNEYVKHAFKVGQLLPNGGISVGDNVIGSAGGFTQLSPTSDPNKRVYRMSFKGLGVDTNIEQFSKAEYNIFRKAAYNMLGKYSADLTPSIGGDILSKALSVAIGAGASKILELIKLFGGAKDVNAHIDISVEELEMLNPELIRKWHVPHNLDYGKYGKPSKASNIDRVTRYFKVNGYLPPFARPKGTVPYNYGDHPEYDPAAIKRLMKKNNRNVVKDTSLEPSKAVKTIKKMAKTKSIGFDRNEPIVRRKKKKT